MHQPDSRLRFSRNLPSYRPAHEPRLGPGDFIIISASNEVVPTGPLSCISLGPTHIQALCKGFCGLYFFNPQTMLSLA